MNPFFPSRATNFTLSRGLISQKHLCREAIRLFNYISQGVLSDQSG